MPFKFNPFTETLDYYEAGGAGTPATTVQTEKSYSISEAVGVSSNYAREDHTHGTMSSPFSGLALITVAAVAPGAPGVGDLWVDIS